MLIVETLSVEVGCTAVGIFKIFKGGRWLWNRIDVKVGVAGNKDLMLHMCSGRIRVEFPGVDEAAGVGHENAAAVTGGSASLVHVERWPCGLCPLATGAVFFSVKDYAGMGERQQVDDGDRFGRLHVHESWH